MFSISDTRLLLFKILSQIRPCHVFKFCLTSILMLSSTKSKMNIGYSLYYDAYICLYFCQLNYNLIRYIRRNSSNEWKEFNFGISLFYRIKCFLLTLIKNAFWA